MIRPWIPSGQRKLVTGQSVEQYQCDQLVAFVAVECGRWHLSLSRIDKRYPTWDEIADARYDLLPDDRDFALVLPPRNDYVNVGPVFHVHEIRDPELPIDRGLAMTRTYESGLAVPA